MKDSEFIELLNLYLDHEISAEDAARIEAEVQQNPARRRVYQDYCRMQKACTLLAKDYVDQAVATSVPEDRKIAAFEPRRSWGLGVYAGGLAAAAACVALVVLANRSTSVAPIPNAANPVAALTPSTSAPVDVNVQLVAGNSAARTIAQTVTVAAQHSDQRPVFAASPLGMSKGNVSAGTLVAADQPALDARFEWINSMQLSPVRVPADNLRFDAKTDLKADPRTYGPGHLQSDVQNAAFQFQR